MRIAKKRDRNSRRDNFHFNLEYEINFHYEYIEYVEYAEVITY